MNELLLHPTTKQHLDLVIGSMPHAVILSGTQGSGKITLALHIAKQILNKQNLLSYPYFLQILPDNHSIGIDAIRQIKAFVGKKTNGTSDIRRIILIGDAHVMTAEAQNALLKVLEEPPADTMLLLTVNDMNALNTTVISRAQHMTVLPLIKKAAINELSTSGYSEQSIASAYHMSGGLAGLLTALLQQNNDHEVANAINTAKEFLRMGTYERLLHVDTLSKQKEPLKLFIDGLLRVVASGLEQAALKNNHIQFKKFHNLSTILQAAQVALHKNANAKLVLSNLFLQM